MHTKKYVQAIWTKLLTTTCRHASICKMGRWIMLWIRKSIMFKMPSSLSYSSNLTQSHTIDMAVNKTNLFLKFTRRKKKIARNIPETKTKAQFRNARYHNLLLNIQKERLTQTQFPLTFIHLQPNSLPTPNAYGVLTQALIKQWVLQCGHHLGIFESNLVLAPSSWK